jgi:hypothetical protein
MTMSDRYRLFKRSKIYYAQDNLSGRQESLRTRYPREAQRLLEAKNDAVKAPHLGLALAKAYLTALDPQMDKRTWSNVMEHFQGNGKESTRIRCERACQSKPFDLIRHKLLIETTSEDFLHVMKTGGASVNHYLRRLHNLAIGLGWMVCPILPSKFWPKIQPTPKRAITLEEHRRIVAAEQNVERRLYYELLWETGAAQSDAVALSSDNLDRETGTLIYARRKTGQHATLQIGAALERVLKQLPTQGPFFPRLSVLNATDRSAEFSRRCKVVGTPGPCPASASEDHAA